MIQLAIQRYDSDEWIWIDLPVDNIDDYAKGWYIVDCECEHFHTRISEFSSIVKLQELDEKLSDLNEYEFDIFIAITEAATDDLFEAFEIFESEEYDFYNFESIEDLAEEFIDEGLFGQVSEKLLNYIDYEKISNDLRFDGYVETSRGIIIFN